MRIPAWERENFRLNKGNIFPSRNSLVSDIPSGEGKTAKHFLRCGVKDLLPSTRFTQETERKEILGLAQGGGHLEQFLYRNVLIAEL